jgi:hypothetical protein
VVALDFVEAPARSWRVEVFFSPQTNQVARAESSILSTVSRGSWQGRDPRQEARKTLRVPRHLVVRPDPDMSHATRTRVAGLKVRASPCQLLPSAEVLSLRCGGRQLAEKSRKVDLLPAIGG